MHIDDFWPLELQSQTSIFWPLRNFMNIYVSCLWSSRARLNWFLHLNLVSPNMNFLWTLWIFIILTYGAPEPGSYISTLPLRALTSLMNICDYWCFPTWMKSKQYFTKESTPTSSTRSPDKPAWPFWNVEILDHFSLYFWMCQNMADVQK